MAQRRMFSLQIVDSDAFLEMPQSTQLLYFHLSMRADDDGFVDNPKKIIKICGCGDIDYKILIVKRFIISFESGIVVIKHWKIHNYIQSDRYHETKYVDEKKLLTTKENGAYTECIQNVSNLDTEVRLGKDRLDKVSIVKDTYGEFDNVKLSINEYYKMIEKIGENNTKLLIEELSTYLASTGKKYSSHYATLLNWARRKVVEHNDKLKTKKVGSV